VMAQKWFHNEACWSIENADVCVTVISSGANIAALALKQRARLYSLRIVDFALIDSDQYCPSMDAATYGMGPEVRKLLWLNVGENHEDRLGEPRYTGGSTRRVS
jgi:hypothetical protein